MDSLEVLNKDIALLKNFQRMSPAEMDSMTMRLRPFFEAGACPG